MLGKLTTDGKVGARDAVHVATLTVEAGARLYPGQGIDVDKDMKAFPAEPGIGIVDPFLKGVVHPGVTFHICVYPETVTGITHNWSLKALDLPSKEMADDWLRQFAEKFTFSYDDMMEHAKEFVECGEIHVPDTGNESDQSHLEDHADEFWRNYEAFTGMSVGEDKHFIGCNCY